MNHRHDDSYDEHLREGVRHLSEVGLSDAARSRIRGSLVAFARENPAAAGVSPRRLKFPGVESPWAGELLSMEMVTRPALASALVALLIGSTISYAAEVSLPGDPLYWVKTEVSEPVADIITISDAAQAEWDARKVERRLEEALALAEADRLDESAQNQIEAGLERGIAEFSEHVGTVLVDDPALAAVVRAELEVTLRAHQEVLVGLGEGSAKNEAAAIAGRANELADAVAADRVALEASLAEQSSFLETTVSAKAGAASREVTVARRALAEIHGQPGVDSATEADASAKLARSAEAYADGDAATKAGNFSAAFDDYQDSHRFAKEARLITLTDGRSDGGAGGEVRGAASGGDKKEEKNKGKGGDVAPDDDGAPEGGADRGKGDDGAGSDGAVTVPGAEVNADLEVKTDVGHLNLL